MVAAVDHHLIPTGIEDKRQIDVSVEVYLDGEVGRRTYGDPSKLELID